VKNQIRAETYKLVTTRTTAGVAATTVGLVALAVLLHTFGLPLEELSTETQQRGIVTDVGVNLVLFSALLGALSITSEYRTGTIRPTLLITPTRSTVVAARRSLSSRHSGPRSPTSGALSPRSSSAARSTCHNWNRRLGRAHPTAAVPRRRDPQAARSAAPILRDPRSPAEHGRLSGPDAHRIGSAGTARSVADLTRQAAHEAHHHVRDIHVRLDAAARSVAAVAYQGCGERGGLGQCLRRRLSAVVRYPWCTRDALTADRTRGLMVRTGPRRCSSDTWAAPCSTSVNRSSADVA
jgi:hypothetical protein